MQRSVASMGTNVGVGPVLSRLKCKQTADKWKQIADKCKQIADKCKQIADKM